MSLFYDATAGAAISRFVQLEPDQTLNQVISQSLDGTTYIQTIGEPQPILSGTVYVDRSGRNLLLAAQANGNLCRVEQKYGVFYGRIISLSFGPWLAGNNFAASIKIEKEAST